MNRLVKLLMTMGLISVLSAEQSRRILGGSVAEWGEFPFMASLRYNWEHFCGGSIISEFHVLTAAHCVQGHTVAPYDNARIVTGTNHLERLGTWYGVAYVVFHTSYDQNNPTSPFDIAIIETKAPILFDRFTKFIHLAAESPPVGIWTLAIGWGLHSVDPPTFRPELYKVPMQIIDLGLCQRYHTDWIYDHQICAFGPPGMGVCNGDSGGPLIYNRQLIGLVSWGQPCARGVPDVFTSTYSLSEWIDNVVRLGAARVLYGR